MNPFVFTLWIYSIFKLLGFIRTGNALITLQSFFIAVAPGFTIIAIVYLCLALPFPAALQWKRPHLAHER